MSTATINDLAQGATRNLIGQTFDVGSPGLNAHHTNLIDGKRVRTLPTRWLDFPEPKPERCPTCGHLLEEEAND